MANRTKNRVPAALRIPTFITNPSKLEWENALTITEDKKAHMMRTRKIIKLEYKNGEFYFDDIPESQIDWSEILADNQTNEDIMPLAVLFSAVEQQMEKEIRNEAEIDWDTLDSKEVEVYVPELMKKMGLQTNISRLQVGKLIEKIMGYENIIGCIPRIECGELVGYVFSRVMVWKEYDTKSNTIKFESPYMYRLKHSMYLDSLVYDGDYPVLKNNGRQKRIPTMSRLLKGRSKYTYGYEIARYICNYIETLGGTGDRVPRVSFGKIIEKCPDLQSALEKSKPADRNKLMKRAFKEGLVILDKDSRLREAYIDIQIPDTDAIEKKKKWSDYVTSYGRRNDFFWTFPHKGRNPKYLPDEILE